MTAFIKSFATPIVWVFVLLVIGLVLTWKLTREKRYRTGWFCLFSAAFVLYLFSIDPCSRMFCFFLEEDFMKPAEHPMPKIDAVVVLGGGVLPSNAVRKHAVLTGAAWPRLMQGIDSFFSLKADYLVLSGGPNYNGGEDEAHVMESLAVRLGVPRQKIVLEPFSMNTYEEAQATRKLLSFLREPAIGLVTSALHMKRSLWSFRQYYQIIVPIPSDYAYTPGPFSATSFIPSIQALSLSTDCIHEIIGNLWYRISHAAK